MNASISSEFGKSTIVFFAYASFFKNLQVWSSRILNDCRDETTSLVLRYHSRRYRARRSKIVLSPLHPSREQGRNGVNSIFKYFHQTIARRKGILSGGVNAIIFNVGVDQCIQGVSSFYR